MIPKKSEQLDFSLFDSVGVGILLVDIRTNTIEFANKEINSLSLYEVNELVGKNIQFIFSPTSHQQIEELFKLEPICADTTIMEHDTLLKRKSGSTTHVTLSVKKAGYDYQRIVTLMDSQPRRELETELEKLYAQMIHTSKYLSLAEMAAGIAHEINNPLAIIQSYAEQIQLRNKLGKLENKISVDLSEKIVKATLRASKIINTLKKLSRNEDEISFSNINVNDLISEIVDLSQERIQGYGIDFHYDQCPPELHIHGNAPQLLQILINLIENSLHAVKETTPRKIAIHIEECPTTIRFRVKDSGPGVPEEIQASIMNPFFTTKEVGQGTGLGLSISKMIIEKHQGNLFYEDSEEGACFCIEIPKALASDQDLKNQAHYEIRVDTNELSQVDEKNSNPKEITPERHVLIVDDESDLTMTLKYGLENHGYAVDVAGNGVEALKLLNNKHFGVVLTDVRMPQMNGFDLMSNISNSLSYKPKVFFITGSSQLDAAELFDKGAEGFFFKPVSLFKIINKLEDTLQGHQKYFHRSEDRIAFQNTYELSKDKETKSEGFNIGRGGLFISSKKSLPTINSLVQFNLNISDRKTPLFITGTGIVRWTREKTMDDRKRGFGIEFYSFDEANKKRLCDFLDNIKDINYIPIK